MPSIRLCIFGCVLVVGFSSIGACAQTDPLPDIRQKMQAQEYADALRLIGPALTMRNADDETMRYDLLMMRGECQLQLNQRAVAANSFEAAGKDAPDARSAAVAQANALLLRASPGNKYVPRPGAQPIDILNPESRKQAFAALRDNLAKETAPKVQAALDDPTLVPTMKVLPSLIDELFLDYAATGSADQTHDQLKALGEHARKLMNAELHKYRVKTELLEDIANGESNGGRRGLTSPQREDLKNAIDYVTKIGETARRARRRAHELGFDTSAWEPIIADADDLVERQQDLLLMEPH